MSNWHRVMPWARWVSGILVGVVCLWLSFRSARLETVLGEIADLTSTCIWLACIGILLISMLKALRWQWLFPLTAPPLTWATHFSILMTTQMLNLLIPVRLGEVARLGLMRQEGRPIASTLGTIVLEKSLDLLAVQALIVITLPLAFVPEWLRSRVGLGALMLSLGVPLLLVVLIRLRGVLAQLLAHLPAAERSAGARLVQRIAGMFQTMLDSMAALEGRQLLRLVVLTTGIWLLSLVVIQMMLAAFALPVDWGAALILMLALTFSNWVPTPPGLLGVVGAVTVVVLAPFGIASAQALALGTVLNGILVVPPIVLGAWFTWERLWRLPAAARAGRLATALGINLGTESAADRSQQEGPSR